MQIKQELVMDQSIWHFGTKLAKGTQLSLSGPYIKAHEV